MIAPLLALTLAAAPSPIQLAAPGFECVNLEPNVCALYTDTFAQLLAERGGLRVTTQREIAALLGMERQRELLGCSAESASCLAELAGALGVDGVVTGSLGKLGSAYTVNVKIISARDGSSLGAKSGRVKDDDALHEWMVETAHELAEVLTRQRGSESTTAVSRSSGGGLRGSAWIPLVAGGLALGLGGAMIAMGNADARAIREPTSAEPATLTAVKALRSAGEAKQGAGVALVAVGAAAVLVGAGFFLFGAPGEPVVALRLSPEAVGVGLSWELP